MILFEEHTSQWLIWRAYFPPSKCNFGLFTKYKGEPLYCLQMIFKSTHFINIKESHWSLLLVGEIYPKMPGFKQSLLKGQNTFLTFRCPVVISRRQFKERKKENVQHRGTYGDTERSSARRKRWLTAQKTHQHCFPGAVYLHDKFWPPNSPFGCGGHRGRREMAKTHHADT